MSVKIPGAIIGIDFQDFVKKIKKITRVSFIWLSKHESSRVIKSH